jgi:adenosylcobyric acid synthase
MAKALMIQGTASHVGKSVLTAALASWLRSQGWRVAPFKAQNMSLNSFVTLAGEEIARSQAAQAAALGLEPTADMNPILLKPLDSGCQVIAHGQAVGLMSIHDYYAWKPTAWQAIVTSYDRLAQNVDCVVLEGAGSPAEINLKDNDLVNMRMAHHANATVLLVADIERGGVFAQLVGTWELLDPTERQRVVGFIINKFRGDARLLQSGLDYIQRHTGRPVLGVLPFDADVALDEEDSLGLAESPTTGEIDIAVMRLPGISNFTDLASLTRAPGVAVRYVSEPHQLGRPDLIVLPGTRTTARALSWLQASGLADVLCDQARDAHGPYIVGLCGGYQLLGHWIEDPDGVEEKLPRTPALGLLDVTTRFESRKTLCRVQGEVLSGLSVGQSVIGYEVHQGVSQRHGGQPWLRLRRQSGEVIDDGAISERVHGTYVHGLFDDARFCRAVVAALRQRRGLTPLATEHWANATDFAARQSRHRLTWLRNHCDLSPIVAALGLPPGALDIQSPLPIVPTRVSANADR